MPLFSKFFTFSLIFVIPVFISIILSLHFLSWFIPTNYSFFVFHLIFSFQLSIHPSIFYRLILRSGRGWAGAYPSSLRARGGVHPGQIASPSQGLHRDKRDKQTFTLALTPKDNLESSINLTYMFLDGGRKPEYPERTHAYTGRTC